MPGPVEYRKLLEPTKVSFKQKRILGLGNKKVQRQITGKLRRRKYNFIGKAVDAVAETVSTQANIDSKAHKIKESLLKQAIETEKITNLTRTVDEHKKAYETAKTNYTEFKNIAELSINDITNNWKNLTEYEKKNKISDLKNRGIISGEFKINSETKADLINTEINKSIENALMEYNEVKKTTENTQQNLEFALERLRKASNKIKKIEQATKVGKSSQDYMTAARKARKKNIFSKSISYSTYTPEQLDILAKVSASDKDLSIDNLRASNPNATFNRSFINKIKKIQGSREYRKFIESAKRSTQNTNRLVSQGSNAVLDLKNMENRNLAQIESEKLPENKENKLTKSERQFRTERQKVFDTQKKKLTENLNKFTKEYFASSENLTIKELLETSSEINSDLQTGITFDELLEKLRNNNTDAYEKISKDPNIRAEYDKFIRDKALELPDTQRTFLLEEIKRKQNKIAVVKLGLTVDTTVEKIANVEGYDLNNARTALKQKSSQYSTLSTKNIADMIKTKYRKGTNLTYEENYFLTEYNTTLDSQISKSKKQNETNYPKETPDAEDLTALTKNKEDKNVKELTDLFTEQFKNQSELKSQEYNTKLKTNQALYGNTIGEILTQLQVSKYIPASSESVNKKLTQLLNTGTFFPTSTSTSAELKANLLKKFTDAIGNKERQPAPPPKVNATPPPATQTLYGNRFLNPVQPP